MNIAYVLPEFPTEKECGGLGIYHDNISRLLANEGHKITVFVKSDRTESISYEPGVFVERVFVDLSKVNPELPGSFMREWSRVLNQKAAQYQEKHPPFDIIQYSNLSALAFDRLNVPTVVRISSYLPLLRAADQEIFEPQKTYEPFKISDYLEEIALIRADAVYSPSQLLADTISSRTGCDIQVIESPFYPRKASPNHSGIFKEQLAGKKYVLTFGTLKILKGAKVIGDSIHEILESCPELYWVFAGAEYPWKDSFGNIVQPSEYIRNGAGEHADRVIFLGKLAHQELYDVVQNALFCVMPSRIDNLPNTCIEAMALGKIVIGTRGASFEQLIEDGKSGYLIERENQEMLVNTVKNVNGLSDEVKHEIEEYAANRIEKMSTEKTLHELLTFYKDVILSFPKVRKREVNKQYKEITAIYNRLLLDTKIKEARNYLIR